MIKKWTLLLTLFISSLAANPLSSGLKSLSTNLSSINLDTSELGGIYYYLRMFDNQVNGSQEWNDAMSIFSKTYFDVIQQPGPLSNDVHNQVISMIQNLSANAPEFPLNRFTTTSLQGLSALKSCYNKGQLLAICMMLNTDSYSKGTNQLVTQMISDMLSWIPCIALNNGIEQLSEQLEAKSPG